MKSVIYARVSSREQAREGFSIPAQLKLLKSYAEKKDYEVTKEFVDIETAKKTGRTNFTKMLKFLEDNPAVKLLLVEKTDRLYRNIKDWVILDDVMDQYNIEVHFVKENFILSPNSKSMEKFMHGIKVLMAKNYIDNLSDEIKKGMKEKVLQGGYPHKAPVGYVNNLQTKKIDIDPEKADYVRRLFELYASGNYSLKALRRKCIEDSFCMWPSHPKIAISSLEYILKNEFYIGYFTWKGNRYKGKHTPLVSRELFEAVQKQFKSHNKPKEIKRNFTYSGLLTCANCGCSITSEIKKKIYIYYHCTNYHGNCKPVFVREEILDEQFEEAIKSFHFDEDIVEWIKLALKSSLEDKRLFHDQSINKLQSQYKKLQSRIEKIYIDNLDGKISEDFWKEKDSLWREQQDIILQKIEAHKKADENYMETGIKTIELFRKATLQYSEKSTKEKRKFLKILLSNSQLDGKNLILKYRKPFDLIGKLGDLESGKLLEIPSIHPKKTKWLRRLDSNQGCRLQRPMPYRLATPQPE